MAGKDQIEQVPIDAMEGRDQFILAEGEENDIRHLSRIFDKNVHVFKVQDMEADDPAAILYTSATKRFPKGATLEPEDIIVFCRTKMAEHKVPQQIQSFNELPKSPTGKVLKRVLRASA